MLIRRATYQRELRAAYSRGAADKRTGMEAAQEAELDGLRAALVHTQQARDHAENTTRHITARLDELEARASRLLGAWYSARGRANALRRHHDAAAEELADHTPAVQIDDPIGGELLDLPPLETDAGWWKAPWRPHP